MVQENQHAVASVQKKKQNSEITFVVGGLGRAHESMEPPMGRAIGHLNESAGFLAGGVRGWLAGGLRASESARAPSERELTCTPCFREAFGSL